MIEKFTKQNILEVLEAAANNLMFLRDTIERDDDFDFDLDVAVCYGEHELKPVLEYLESLSDHTLPALPN